MLFLLVLLLVLAGGFGTASAISSAVSAGTATIVLVGASGTAAVKTYVPLMWEIPGI